MTDGLLSLLAEYRPPEFIRCAPITAAMIEAAAEFSGRDWRRIKREVNKATRAARKDRHAL